MSAPARRPLQECSGTPARRSHPLLLLSLPASCSNSFRSAGRQGRYHPVFVARDRGYLCFSCPCHVYLLSELRGNCYHSAGNCLESGPAHSHSSATKDLLVMNGLQQARAIQLLGVRGPPLHKLKETVRTSAIQSFGNERPPKMGAAHDPLRSWPECVVWSLLRPLLQPSSAQN